MQSFIIVMLKLSRFFPNVVLIHRYCYWYMTSGMWPNICYIFCIQYNSIGCSGGWVEWLRLAGSLCVRKSARASVGVPVGCLSGICQGVCWRISQSTCQGICLASVRASLGVSVAAAIGMSVETFFNVSVGASVMASAGVSGEPSLGASIDLNCIISTESGQRTPRGVP